MIRFRFIWFGFDFGVRKGTCGRFPPRWRVDSGERVDGEEVRARLRQQPPSKNNDDEKRMAAFTKERKKYPYRYSSSLRRAFFLLSESHCGVLFPDETL
mgnify:CR=1 FL=1